MPPDLSSGLTRLHLRAGGIVQGVGFRPFVFRTANALGLVGTVHNHTSGVSIDIQGAPADVGRFVSRLRTDLPPAARIERLDEEELPPDPTLAEFRILKSAEGGRVRAVLPADQTTCPACLNEVDDPSDRRYRYPFTNCTECGPRYSIVTKLPYDRPNTTMRGFPLCPLCRAEYENQGDRRHHAQPIACPECGPQLALIQSEARTLAAGDTALRAAAQALLDGKVLALKGLGGFQLLVDATNDRAVRSLRERKCRPDKPLAVLFSNVEEVARHAVVSAAEVTELTGSRGPIVLLEKRAESSLSPGVAPQNPRVGALLPTTPLHHLLARAAGRPLVCTSGNLSNEPMAYLDDEAQLRLAHIADLFLTHDRPIVRPVDDSVVRVDEGRPKLLRRARGFAPRATFVAVDSPPILALGAHQKNTLTLLSEGEAIVSQHLGDMDSPEALALLFRTAHDLLDHFDVAPHQIVCDLHPDYGSTALAQQLADEFSVPLLRVQHHHAHALACAAEHGHTGPLTALTWDGTGLGLDGQLWGGEALVVDGTRFRRVGGLRPFPLPGGESAIREPRRSALGLWSTLDPQLECPELALCFAADELRTLGAMLARSINCPSSSSMGRLFDACAALLDVRTERGFDGQAAMALEFAADDSGVGRPLPWTFAQSDSFLEADARPLVRALIEQRRRRVPSSQLAGDFHRSLADLALRWADHAGQHVVALTGGCFQNALLARLVEQRLSEAGFRVLTHHDFPAGDGSLSLGQAMAGAFAHRSHSAITH